MLCPLQNSLYPFIINISGLDALELYKLRYFLTLQLVLSFLLVWNKSFFCSTRGYKLLFILIFEMPLS